MEFVRECKLKSVSEYRKYWSKSKTSRYIGASLIMDEKKFAPDLFAIQNMDYMVIHHFAS
jgi:hypothetical protein